MDRYLLQQRKSLIELAEQGYDVSSDARLLDGWIKEYNDDERERWRRDMTFAGIQGIRAVPPLTFLVPSRNPNWYTDSMLSAARRLIRSAGVNRRQGDRGAAFFCLRHAARIRRTYQAARELLG